VLPSYPLIGRKPAVTVVSPPPPKAEAAAAIRRIFIACLTTILALAGLYAANAQAGVVLETTRVIYSAEEREISVPLLNDNKDIPTLVQVWIDDGNEKSTPNHVKVPFLIVPPLFRMEPGKGSSLRIAYLDDQPLPTDKESVFWLNVLEVPPNPKATKGETSNTLQLAFRTRVKFFFRPTGLKGTADDAPSRLRWHLLHEGSQAVLQVENPSAYYVSFESLALVIGGKKLQYGDAQMIAPGGTQRFVFDDMTWPAGTKSEVQFSSIDDHGLIVPHSAPLLL
jgi:chaperone protein EcpD